MGGRLAPPAGFERKEKDGRRSENVIGAVNGHLDQRHLPSEDTERANYCTEEKHNTIDMEGSAETGGKDKSSLSASWVLSPCSGRKTKQQNHGMDLSENVNLDYENVE